MECIEINIRKETAEKWKKASNKTRERIERKIEMELVNEKPQKILNEDDCFYELC